MRGTDECNAYYRMLRDELQDRVRRGIGGLREERHRLLWDNLPIWFAVRELSTTLARDREALSDRITNWIRENANLEMVDQIVTQSSDKEFHCLSITLFYRVRED